MEPQEENGKLPNFAKSIIYYVCGQLYDRKQHAHDVKWLESLLCDFDIAVGCAEESDEWNFMWRDLVRMRGVIKTMLTSETERREAFLERVTA